MDAVAEIRFSSSIPNDAVIGLVYSTLKSTFGKPENLPILQIPLAIREKDQNLRYQPGYRFKGPGNVLLVGPHSVALSTYPYSHWGSASGLLSDLLGKLSSVGLFDKVERLGLRYINFFEENVLDRSTVTLAVRGASLASQSVTLRTETIRDNFTVITQISNAATTVVDGVAKKGSIIDLDIVHDGDSISTNSLADDVMKTFVSANELADLVFFELLTEEFVATFGPEY